MPLDPHVAQALGSSIETVWWPSGQYQTGMRWPHHNWREMFQSRRLSIHWRYGLTHRSGENATRPSSTAAFAGAFRLATFTNHCWPESQGSTSVSQR